MENTDVRLDDETIEFVAGVIADVYLDKKEKEKEKE